MGSESIFVDEEHNHDNYDSSLGLFVVKAEDENDSWHDNWLFRHPVLTQANNVTKSVAMLLPNATDDIKVQIGNEDFDLVSELTENVPEGIEELTSDEDIDMSDNIDTNHPENDNEYTIYEMMIPVRKCNDRTGLVNSLQNRYEPPTDYGTNLTYYFSCKDGIKHSAKIPDKMINAYASGYLWLGEEIGESSTDDLVIHSG